MLGVGGGLAGFAAAYYGVDLLIAAFGTALPRASEVDGRQRGCWRSPPPSRSPPALLAAFVPAWQLTGRDANEALKTGPGRGNSSAATAACATCSSSRKWRSR